MKKKILLIYSLIICFLAPAFLNAAPWDNEEEISQEQIYSEGYGNILNRGTGSNNQQTQQSQNSENSNTNLKSTPAATEKKSLLIAQQLEVKPNNKQTAKTKESRTVLDSSASSTEAPNRKPKESDLLIANEAQSQPAAANNFTSPDSTQAENKIPVPKEENPAQLLSKNLEDKLFKKVIQAAKLRNYDRFKSLKAVYKRTFPDLVTSPNFKALEALEHGFFYREKLNSEVFPGSYAEVISPSATSLDEFDLYLKRLNNSGFTYIQFDVTQYSGNKLFLFSKGGDRGGFYFKTVLGPVIENLLPTLINLVHKNNMKIQIAFPVRKHPWINYLYTNLMDEYWNPLENSYILHNKLDIINPDGRKYFLDLIKDLIKYPIDSLVFKDDFTYSPNEGFSRYLRSAYYKRYAKKINPKRFFLAKEVKDGRGYELFVKDRFNDLAKWRAERLYLSFTIILKEIKTLKPDLKIGIELTPEMITDNNISIPWYSTGVNYLTNLNFDFFLLKWSKGESILETDFQTFRQAALLLKNRTTAQIDILLKIPLNEKNKNIVNLNKLMYRVVKLQELINPSRKIFGPLKRYRDLELLHGKLN